VDRGVLHELEAADLIVPADKRYQGAAHAKAPYKGKRTAVPEKNVNTAHAKLRSLGERANAPLVTCRVCAARQRDHPSDVATHLWRLSCTVRILNLQNVKGNE
jgi:hypothetical protein